METLVLTTDNPFADGTLVKLPNGEVILTREKIKHTPEINDRRHRVQQEQTLTAIAWLCYREQTDSPEKYWWIIADANNILNPLDLSGWVGRELIIPDFVKSQLH